MPDIASLPKGAVPQPKDDRDFQASFVMGAINVAWDWFHLADPGNEDQGSSSSCVAQAFSYYHRQIHSEDWSRRDLYSRIFLPQGGAYLRDGASQIVGMGQANRASAPDPHPETEQNMRYRADITAEMERIGIEAGYFSVDGRNIDAVAACIRDNKGVVFGVFGTNAGWADLANPRPPKDSDPGQIWGHALYGVGFHMHDGQKCIIVKSSWCNTGVLEHHIKANYFESGNTFDGWTLIPKENITMYRRFKIFDEATGRLGVCVLNDVGFADALIWAKNDAHLHSLIQQYEIPANAPTVTFPRVNPN